MKTKAKRATLYAAALEVACPVCGEAQPSPRSGSEMWEIREVKEEKGKRLKCVSCDQICFVGADSKANVIY